MSLYGKAQGFIMGRYIDGQIPRSDEERAEEDLDHFTRHGKRWILTTVI